MTYLVECKVDEEDSYVRYIYQDVRDELKNLWKAMLTVLGMLGVAISYVSKTSDIIKPGLKFLILSQFLWLFAMIEILLISNYISKHKFLIEIELNLDPSLETSKSKVPFWETWISKYKPPGLRSYTIPVISIIVWSFVAFVMTFFMFIWDIDATAEVKFYLTIVLIFQLSAALWAAYNTYKEFEVSGA